jgi:hypothetical protein
MNQKLEECHMVQLIHRRISTAVLLGHLHLHQSLNRSARAGLLTFSLINDLQISAYLYIDSSHHTKNDHFIRNELN